MPAILKKLGWTPGKAEYLADKIVSILTDGDQAMPGEQPIEAQSPTFVPRILPTGMEL